MNDRDSDSKKKSRKNRLKKKISSDMNERLSLRIDAQEAERYKHFQKRNPVQKGPSKPLDQELKNGLRKIRNKIRDPFDDEDEDENGYVISPIFQQQEENTREDGSLFNSLTADEKRMLQQKETDMTMKMQQNAGRMEALLQADKLSREATNHGISSRKINDGMQEAVFNPDRMHDKLVREDIGSKLGVKGSIEEGKIIQAARGIKRVQQIGGNKEATKDFAMKEVVLAGEGKMSDRELAKMILEKSGQDTSKFETNKQKETKDTKEIKLKHFDLSVKKKETERN